MERLSNSMYFWKSFNKTFWLACWCSCSACYFIVLVTHIVCLISLLHCVYSAWTINQPSLQFWAPGICSASGKSFNTTVSYRSPCQKMLFANYLDVSSVILVYYFCFCWSFFSQASPLPLLKKLLFRLHRDMLKPCVESKGHDAVEER